MSRLTINLPKELHNALKVRAAQQGTTIGELVAESLEFYGIKSEQTVEELLTVARGRSGMRESDALDLAVSETRAARSSGR